MRLGTSTAGTNPGQAAVTPSEDVVVASVAGATSGRDGPYLCISIGLDHIINLEDHPDHLGC